MKKRPAWLHPGPDGVRLDVLVQPRASRTRIVGEHGDRLKVQLTAPPVEGEANAMLIDHLAGALRIPKSDLQILAGATGRRKSVRIDGLEAEAVLERLSLD